MAAEERRRIERALQPGPQIERTTPKQQPRAYILPEHQALTAFPWLETPAEQKMQRLVRLLDMIQKCRDFYGQVITRLDEL